jgi:hypothetical protein
VGVNRQPTLPPSAPKLEKPKCDVAWRCTLNTPFSGAVPSGADIVFAMTWFVTLVPSGPIAWTAYEYLLSGRTSLSTHDVVVASSVVATLPFRLTT